jgi:hypothetical protein
MSWMEIRRSKEIEIEIGDRGDAREGKRRWEIA